MKPKLTEGHKTITAAEAAKIIIMIIIIDILEGHCGPFWKLRTEKNYQEWNLRCYIKNYWKPSSRSLGLQLFLLHSFLLYLLPFSVPQFILSKAIVHNHSYVQLKVPRKNTHLLLTTTP